MREMYSGFDKRNGDRKDECVRYRNCDVFFVKSYEVYMEKIFRKSLEE